MYFWIAVVIYTVFQITAGVAFLRIISNKLTLLIMVSHVEIKDLMDNMGPEAKKVILKALRKAADG